MMRLDLDWDRVTVDDLPEEMRHVERAGGMELVRVLVETYGGESLYVSALRELRRRQLAERAAALYDGSNGSAVCRKLRISRRTLNKLLEEARGEEGEDDERRAAA